MFQYNYLEFFNRFDLNRSIWFYHNSLSKVSTQYFLHKFLHILISYVISLTCNRKASWCVSPFMHTRRSQFKFYKHDISNTFTFNISSTVQSMNLRFSRHSFQSNSYRNFKIYQTISPKMFTHYQSILPMMFPRHRLFNKIPLFFSKIKVCQFAMTSLQLFPL